MDDDLHDLRRPPPQKCASTRSVSRCPIFIFMPAQKEGIASRAPPFSEIDFRFYRAGLGLGSILVLKGLR